MKKFLSTTRMTSRRTSPNKKVLYMWVCGVIALALLFLLPRIFATATALIFIPVNATATYFSESSATLPSFFRDRTALLHEIRILKDAEQTKTDAEVLATELKNENEKLRALVGGQISEKILAGVVGRPGGMPYDILILDKGTEQGVVEGAPVFIASTTVIGLVKKSFLHSSVVELMSSPGFTSSVYVIGPDIYTTASGMGGGQMRIGVPQGIALTEGDVVVTPAAGLSIYGRISVVESIPSQPEQYGYVSFDVPLASIRFVAVGKEALQPIDFEEAQEIVSQTKSNLLTIPVPDDMLVLPEASTSTPAQATGTQESI